MFSVVQKVVHPLSRGLGRLRIDMSTGNTGVWAWKRRLHKYVSVDGTVMKLNTDKVRSDLV